MITISLDEQGVFENNTEPAGDIVMIAGVIYDDYDKDGELEREKSRIREYFQKVCQQCHAIYPRALHIGHGQDNKVSDVKTEYTNSLGDFLSMGTYRGAEVQSSDGISRAGKYYVYAFVKSRNGKKSLISADVSNLINENMASNLYMHMVEDTISRLLFYNNIFIDHEMVALDLATRVYKGNSNEDISAHTDMGYRTRLVNDGELVFLTNSDVFRTALERDMLYESENDIDISSLMARSINYNDANAGHELLYLADAVCTCLGYQNDYGVNKAYLAKVWDRMRGLAGDNRLLFAYDEVDTGFVRAWRCAENSDIYKALSIEYDALSEENEVTNFYAQIWERELFKRIVRNIDVSSFTTAIRKFAQSTKNNNINQHKLIFLFEKLHELADVVSFENAQDMAVLYELYDAGASAYNHVGNPEKARICFEKCNKYSRYIGIERELRNRNKIAVGLCDSFKYKEAEKIAVASYEYYKAIFNTQRILFGDDTRYNSAEYGIVCSQLGQVYGFMNDNRAELMFKQALDLLEPGTADYYITESYLLHYYLMINDRQKYEQYALEYFGGCNDLSQQMEYAIRKGAEEKNPIISLKFAMFVFVKSIYKFYLDEISIELLDKLLDIETTLENVSQNSKKLLNGHPWEITYKYLAMISFKAKKPQITTYYMKKINTSLKISGSTLDAIKLFGELELAQLRSPGLDVKNKINQLVQLIKKENNEIEVGNDFNSLEKIITYTYR